MPPVAEELRLAARSLAESGVADPVRESASLLAFAIGRGRTFLIAHPEYELTDGESAAFADAVERRCRREPFQYITGVQEFWGLAFAVTPDVLIPRPETELIVESAIGILSPLGHPRFCEVGTGSGCITVATLSSLPQATATALDISSAAIAVARQNAETHQVADRVRFVVSDVFDALAAGDRFDLIASNPPYVPLGELAGLQDEVREHEPEVALTDGADGLSIIARLIDGAPQFLVPGGRLLMEIGFAQAERVRAMFSPEVWAEVDVVPDLQGIPRMVTARLS